MKPWEQQSGESSQAYRAARIYFELGPTRTLVAVSRALDAAQDGPSKAQREPKKGPTGPTGTVKRWAKQHTWRERAQAFDRNLDQAADRGRESERAGHAATLERRRAQIADDNWAIGQAIRVKGIEMAQWPIKETVSSTTV